MLRLATLLIGCALVSACGTQHPKIDNLNWDIQPDPIYRETAVRHSRPKDPDERYDPQEYDPTLESVFVEADAIAERLVGNVPRDEKFGAVFWSKKKQLLAQEYGIDWQSPADLNPSIEYGNYGQSRLDDAEKSRIRAMVIDSLESDNAEVNSIGRQFSGEVVAWAGKDNDIYHFLIEGHRDTWKVKNIGVVEY